jgi:hypothetical protein
MAPLPDGLKAKVELVRASPCSYERPPPSGRDLTSTQSVRQFFDKIDDNKDGSVTLEEATKFWSKNWAKVRTARPSAVPSALMDGFAGCMRLR